MQTSSERINWEPQEKHQFMFDAVNGLIEDNGMRVILNHTVDELLFKGYEDSLLIVGMHLGLSPFRHFGWMYGKNDTSSDGKYRIFTGEGETQAQIGFLDTWKDKPVMNVWQGKECNTIHDSSPGDLRPPLFDSKPR